MKQHIHSILFLAGALLARVFTACTDDFVDKRTTTTVTVDDSNLVDTRLALNVAVMGSPTVMTRATGDGDPMKDDLSDDEKRGSAAERQIDNIWVFQFNTSGDLLITPRYYDLSTAITPDATTPETVEVLLKPDVESTVYVVANTGDKTWATAANSPSLDSLGMRAIPNPNFITVDDNGSLSGRIPMEGRTTEHVMPGKGKTIGVTVTRMYAKVEIRVGDTIPETINITGIDVKKIPYYCRVKSLYLDHENDRGRADYPADMRWTSHAFDPGDKNIEGKYEKTMVLYIPENLQGQLQDGHPDQPEYKTNLAFTDAFSLDYKANYVSFGEIVGSERSYVFYPGADDWRDYNIKRNRIYRASLNIFSDLYNQPIPSSNCFVVKPGQLLSFLPYYRTEEGGGHKFENHLDADGDETKRINDNRTDMTQNVEIIWQTEGAIGDNSKGDLVWIDPSSGTDADTKQRKIYVRAGKEGNALIAAYNKNHDIVWSWHIWVTENDPANVSSAVTYSTYTWNEKGIISNIRVPGYAIMPCNLGALAYEPEEGEEAHNNGAYKTKIAPKTHGMLYQWGRKDPFPPSIIGTDGSARVYDDNVTGPHYGNANTNEAAVGKTSDTDVSKLFHSALMTVINPGQADNMEIAYSIKNPTVFICGTKEADKGEEYVSQKPENYVARGDWQYNHDETLWGGTTPVLNGMKHYTIPGMSDHQKNAVHIFDNYGDKKSIYDPCPSGWRVPPGDLWLGFTQNGMNPSRDHYDIINTSTPEKKLNENKQPISGSSAGMYMHMNGWKTGQTIFFPTQGCRVGDGRIIRSASCGNYHNATTDAIGDGQRVNILHIHNDASLFRVFETTYYMYYVKSTAGPIRCVRDHK